MLFTRNMCMSAGSCNILALENESRRAGEQALDDVLERKSLVQREELRGATLFCCQTSQDMRNQDKQQKIRAVEKVKLNARNLLCDILHAASWPLNG